MTNVLDHGLIELEDSSGGARVVGRDHARDGGGVEGGT